MHPDIRLSRVEYSQVLKILLEAGILGKHHVWVFGSRAGGHPRPDSDLDLLFDPSLPLSTKSLLRESFEESSLPFTVDLLNRDDLAQAYQSAVEGSKIAISGEGQRLSS